MNKIVKYFQQIIGRFSEELTCPEHNLLIEIFEDVILTDAERNINMFHLNVTMYNVLYILKILFINISKNYMKNKFNYKKYPY